MNEENPWQKPKKPQNIDEWVDQSLQKLKDFLQKNESPPNGSNSKNNLPGFFPWKGSFVGMAIFGFFALLVVYNSVFQIQPGESGVILRFGKHVRNAPPGLNFMIPFVEDLTKVNIETIRSLEFGSQSMANVANSVADESFMITGDRNVIKINWAVQYRVKNPEDYLFQIQNVTKTIRDFSEYIVRRLVGNRDFDYVLNTREELAFSSKLEMQQLLDLYRSGVEVVALQLLDVTPPETVRPAFNEVNEADQDRTRLVNEAQKEVNEKVPKARGEAQRLILEAEGYAITRINDAKGNSARFDDIYSQYTKYRAVTRTQLYVDTLKEVLPQVSEIYVLDKNNNLLPLLNIRSDKSNSGKLIQ